MHSMSWDDLRYCLAVVEEGSVSAAARKLEVNHTTVSRRISALERELNAALFDRSTTGWLLTPVGETVLSSIEDMAESVHGIRRVVQADRQELSGKLRVTAIDICIQRLLLAPLKAFSALYPDITVELIASDLSMDLATHEADIAFRTTDDPPPNVVGKRIAGFANQVYATREVRDNFESKPQDAGIITWMGDGRTLAPWISKCFPRTPVRYRANSLNVAYDLARQGMGFAMLPCALGDMAPELERCPIDHQEPGRGFWVLSHIDLRTTARIRIFRDFMLEAIAPYVPLIEGERPHAWREYGTLPQS